MTDAALATGKSLDEVAEGFSLQQIELLLERQERREARQELHRLNTHLAAAGAAFAGSTALLKEHEARLARLAGFDPPEEEITRLNF